MWSEKLKLLYIGVSHLKSTAPSGSAEPHYDHAGIEALQALGHEVTYLKIATTEEAEKVCRKLQDTREGYDGIVLANLNWQAKINHQAVHFKVDDFVEQLAQCRKPVIAFDHINLTMQELLRAHGVKLIPGNAHDSLLQQLFAEALAPTAAARVL